MIRSGPLLISVFLHVFIALGIFFWSAPQKIVSPPRPPPQNLVEVELTTAKPSPASGGRVRSQRTSKYKHKSKYKLGNLMPQFSLPTRQQMTDRGQEAVATMDDGDTHTVQGFMRSFGPKEFFENMTFFEKLWQKVELAVEYPDDFVQMGFSGTVLVHLQIDPDGVFRGKFLEIHASNKYLRAYVIACLLQGLRTPLPPAAHLQTKTPIPVAFAFEFKTYSELKPDNRGNYFKNYLTFQKTAYLDPRTKAIVERSITRYLPPVIPIPGGFFVDFVGLYKMIDSALDPGEEQSKLAKLKALQEHMELLIQRHKEKLPNGSLRLPGVTFPGPFASQI